MTTIRRGAIRPSVDLAQEFISRPVTGLVATDGVLRSGVVTFGTTATTIWSQLIDPGFPVQLKEFYFAATQRFTERVGTTGSLSYYWQAREEWNALGTLFTGSWINISATYQKGIASGANSEDTFSGYVPIGTFPRAPLSIRLQAQGLVASSMTGEVKNSTQVRLVGTVIPGAS